MQLGGLAGMTALTMGLGQERGNGQKHETDPATPALQTKDHVPRIAADLN